MNFFLVGFMGSGKSFLGKKLAKDLNFSFIDMDNYIEEMEGTSISNIFRIQGETSFREIEREALHELFQRDNTVIATGGGTPCFFDNMDQMNEYGITIFLDFELDVLVERLEGEQAHRPLIANKSRRELVSFIDYKLQERRPFYEESVMVVYDLFNYTDLTMICYDIFMMVNYDE